MPVPRIAFTEDSASTLDCVSWAATSIIAGQLTAEATEDIPGTVLVPSRAAHEAAKRAFGPQVWGANDPEDEAWVQLADACGGFVSEEPTDVAEAPRVSLNWLLIIRLIAQLLSSLE